MSELEKAFKSLRRLEEIVSSSLPAMAESLSKGKFPLAGKALLSFIPRGDSLTNTILFACTRQDIYSASILFRSLIEHSFRHMFIFTKTLNDNNDSIGVIYINTLKASEDLSAFEKINNYQAVVRPSETKWNTKGDHNNEIREKAKQFEIQKIFHYLIENNNSKSAEIYEYKKEYFLKRLTEYTNMSSSVHGGSFGYFALVEIAKDEKKLEATISNFAGGAIVLLRGIIETTYLFAYLMDEAMKKHYDDVASTAKEMKPLKFKHEFVKEILEGRKTTTWRLFDDKNLTNGDELELIDRDNGESFGKAVITEIVEKKAKELTPEELVNHGYDNLEAMLSSHRAYYGDRVDSETEVKIITFNLL